MSRSQLNMILAIMAGTMLLLCIITGVLYQGRDEKATGYDVETINDAWIVESSADYDTATDLPCHLEFQKGEAVSLSHYLPEQLGNDYAIAFRSVYNEVQVKIGEKVIYQYGVDEKRPFVHAAVPKWNLIPIDAEYAGQLLTITQVSDYSRYAGVFDRVYVGSRDALRYLQWRENGWGVILSAVLILLCLGLSIVVISMRRHLKDHPQLLYYEIFAVTITLWNLSGNPLLASYMGMNYMFWLVHMLMRMLLPVVWLLLLRTYMQTKRLLQLVDLGILAAGIGYVILTVLQVLGLLEFAVTYEAVNVVCGIGFVLYTSA